MKESLSRPFQDLPIRIKLLIGYLIVFFLAVGGGGLFLYSAIRSTLQTNIEKELRTSTQLMRNMVKTSVDSSIRNHLRAVAEMNEDVVRSYWGKCQDGCLTEKEAMDQATQSLLSQNIGKSGYIYVINSEGVIQVHPSAVLVGTDQSAHEHVREQKRRLAGYLEYDWSNPGEDRARPKAMYMSYFAPWDWIISATSYRDEFDVLFSLDELRSSMMSIHFGATGYPYIIDTSGRVLLHPNMEGLNVFNRRDAEGKLLFQEIIEQKDGSLIYSWMNPEERVARKKVVCFNHIKELGWIVASSGYLDELYAPLDVVKTAIFLTMGLILVLIVPFTWWFGGTITTPLQQIMHRFAQGSDDESYRQIRVPGKDEIGQLATCFNRFMDKLGRSRRELERSEREYRSVYENSWEGIIKVTPEGQFLSCNRSMANMLGYDSPEQLMAGVESVREFYVDPSKRDEYLTMVNEKGVVRGLEVQFVKRDGRPIWVSLNSRKITDDEDNFVKLETFVTDITRQKEYDEVRKKTQEQLEKNVATRTAELSYRVSELKALNAQGDMLRELGDHLQVCRETEETFPVIRLFMERLFPEDEVSLFLCDEEREMMDLVLTTSAHRVPASFVRDECWALRKGKAHFADTSGNTLVCPHWKEDQPGGGSLCMPLTAQDEQVGMVQLVVGGASLVSTDGRSNTLVQEKARLLSIVAEHMALALTSIRLRETLRLQSIEDPLTGLYNRRYMMEFLRREVQRIGRTDSRTSIVMLDVDHFKRFNDEYGHEAGDEVLRKLAAYLKANIRTTDLACRFGGEEFVLVMVDTSLDSCRDKAERIRAGIEQDVVVYSGEDRLGVTVSMGVACAVPGDESFDETLQAADAALYKAKENGRNRVETAPSRSGRSG